MTFDDGVNAMFYLSMCTMICSSLTLLIRFCYKSKCSGFKCFCINVKRDIEIKHKIFTIRNGINYNQLKIIYKL